MIYFKRQAYDFLMHRLAGHGQRVGSTIEHRVRSWTRPGRGQYKVKTNWFVFAAAPPEGAGNRGGNS